VAWQHASYCVDSLLKKKLRRFVSSSNAETPQPPWPLMQRDADVPACQNAPAMLMYPAIRLIHSINHDPKPHDVCIDEIKLLQLAAPSR
jgi:hypothetical protein